MSDQYIPPTPIPLRPSIAGTGLDPLRADYRADAPTPTAPSGGGFGAAAIVTSVFVVIAVMAAVLFSNPDLFGFGRTDIPADAPVLSAPADTGTAPIAPTPAPAPAPEAPATPVAPVSPVAPVTP